MVPLYLWFFHIHSSASMDSANHRLCGTVVLIEKNPCINGPVQFKPILFMGQMYIISLSLTLLIWDTCCILLNHLNLDSVLPFFPSFMNLGQKVKQQHKIKMSIHQLNSNQNHKKPFISLSKLNSGL